MGFFSKEDVQKRISGKEFYQPKGTLHNICILVHVSGFVVTGDCGCTDPKKYSKEVGEKVSYDKALNKLMELEAFHYQQNNNK